MAWIKSNLMIVIMLALIVIMLPAAWVGTSMWNASIRKAQEDAANKDYRELQAAEITYEIPAALPGREGWVRKDAPNAELIRQVRELRQRQEEAIGQVVQIAVDFNRNGHEPLVEGLFPKPEQGQESFKTLEMAERLVGPGGRPSAYEQLFTSIKAGGPADSRALAQALSDMYASEMEKARITAGTDQLPPEQVQEITKKLVSLRLGEYQRRAGDVSVYATPAVLPPQVPTQLPAVSPSLRQCFEWQFDYWVIEDLIRAIGRANTGSGGEALPVDRAVVKRIEKIVLDRALPDAANASRGEMETMAAEPAAATPDYRVSVTGRHDNRFYDVRNASLTLIVASERLPELLNAISRTNFMSVTDLDITNLGPAEVWSALEQGYYYGQDHVVRVTLGVETVWLRDWTKQFMPPAVRKELMPNEPEEALDGEAAPEEGGG